MTRYASKPSFDLHRRKQARDKREVKKKNAEKGDTGIPLTALERSRQKVVWKPSRSERSNS